MAQKIVDQDTPEPEIHPSGGLPIQSLREWLFIYGFFLVHMGVFGTVGFVMAYGSGFTLFDNMLFSGFAIFVYIIFYLVIFGLDEMFWLFTNSVLGILGIFAQLDWMLDWFGVRFESFPMVSHIIPAIYYILYTFLLRRALMHIFRAWPGTRRKRIFDMIYILGSLLLYLPVFMTSYLL